MNLDHFNGQTFTLDGENFDQDQALAYLQENEWSEQEARDFLDRLAVENRRAILRQTKDGDEI